MMEGVGWYYGVLGPFFPFALVLALIWGGVVLEGLRFNDLMTIATSSCGLYLVFDAAS